MYTESLRDVRRSQMPHHRIEPEDTSVSLLVGYHREPKVNLFHNIRII